MGSGCAEPALLLRVSSQCTGKGLGLRCPCLGVLLAVLGFASLSRYLSIQKGFLTCPALLTVSSVIQFIVEEEIPDFCYCDHLCRVIGSLLLPVI